jgi:hypothetical protein
VFHLKYHGCSQYFPLWALAATIMRAAAIAELHGIVVAPALEARSVRAHPPRALDHESSLCDDVTIAGFHVAADYRLRSRHPGEFYATLREHRYC